MIEQGTHEGHHVEREAGRAVDEEAEVVEVDRGVEGVPEEVAWIGRPSLRIVLGRRESDGVLTRMPLRRSCRRGRPIPRAYRP